MWLPEKLYQRLPLIWLIAGVAFISAAFYMTFGYEWSLWYFGAGVSCLVWSAILMMVRSRRNKDAAGGGSQAEAAD